MAEIVWSAVGRGDFEDFEDKTVRIYRDDSRDGASIIIDNNDNERLSELFIPGWKPCIVGGFVENRLQGEEYPAKNFYFNWFKKGGKLIKEPEGLVTPRLTLVDAETLHWPGDELNKKNLYDNELRIEQRKINLLYKADDQGHVCFIPTGGKAFIPGCNVRGDVLDYTCIVALNSALSAKKDREEANINFC